MKVVLIIALFFSLNVFSNERELVYGEDYTKIFLADNYIQAIYIKMRYNFIDLYQEVEKSNGQYFIEFLYEDDDKEMITEKIPVIPYRMKDQVKEIYFLNIGNGILSTGNNKLIY